jgi:hypothetical protein
MAEHPHATTRFITLLGGAAAAWRRRRQRSSQRCWYWFLHAGPEAQASVVAAFRKGPTNMRQSKVLPRIATTLSKIWCQPCSCQYYHCRSVYHPALHLRQCVRPVRLEMVRSFISAGFCGQRMGGSPVGHTEHIDCFWRSIGGGDEPVIGGVGVLAAITVGAARAVRPTPEPGTSPRRPRPRGQNRARSANSIPNRHRRGFSPICAKASAARRCGAT